MSNINAPANNSWGILVALLFFDLTLKDYFL